MIERRLSLSVAFLVPTLLASLLAAGSAYAGETPSSAASSVAGEEVTTTAARCSTYADVGVKVLRLKGTSLVMDVPRSSETKGTQLIVYPWRDGQNQCFRLRSAGGHSFWMEPFHTQGFAVGVSRSSKANGAGVIMWPRNTNYSQHWRFYWNDRLRAYEIYNRNSGKCLTANAVASRSKLVQWPCYGYRTQRWVLGYP